MKRNEHDITELLFPLEEQTPEEKQRQEIYGLATEEAKKLVGTSSPISLMNKTKELYKTYLQSQNLVYDEERGF
jgi:hypothetical protein